MIDYEEIKQVLLTIDGQGKERKEEMLNILLNRIKELELMSEIGQEDVIDELESELESLRTTVGEANDEIERLNKILDEEKSLSPIKTGMQAYIETVHPYCKCCGNQMVFNRSLLTWKCNYCGKIKR